MMGIVRDASNVVAKHLKDERELSFYEEHAPEELRGFLPDYLGTADVRFMLDESSLFLLPPSPPSSSGDELLQTAGSDADGGITTTTGTQEETYFVDEGAAACASTNAPSPMNPWGLHCFERNQAKIDPATNGVQRCLLLEDVLSAFSRPCVLDLKIGTRTYRSDASPEKRRRAIAKAKTTTTASMGVRLCGLQVFDRAAHRFLCRNKYFGRGLTDETIAPAIARFFSACPDEHVGTVIGRLTREMKKLADIIGRLHQYRFYSSSLLIVYEGDPTGSDAPDIVVKMIDFSNCSRATTEEVATSGGLGVAEPDSSSSGASAADAGWLLGMHNFIALLEDLALARRRT